MGGSGKGGEEGDEAESEDAGKRTGGTKVLHSLALAATRKKIDALALVTAGMRDQGESSGIAMLNEVVILSKPPGPSPTAPKR